MWSVSLCLLFLSGNKGVQKCVDEKLVPEGGSCVIALGQGLSWQCEFCECVLLQVESGYVCEGDHKTMAKAIKDRVSLIKRKREQRQSVQEEQENILQEEGSQKQQLEQQQPSSASHAGSKHPQSVTGTTAVPTASASVSTQVEPEEPEADQHQQLQFQQPSLSVLCKCLSWSL